MPSHVSTIQRSGLHNCDTLMWYFLVEDENPFQMHSPTPFNMHDELVGGYIKSGRASYVEGSCFKSNFLDSGLVVGQHTRRVIEEMNKTNTFRSQEETLATSTARNTWIKNGMEATS